MRVFLIYRGNALWCIETPPQRNRKGGCLGCSAAMRRRFLARTEHRCLHRRIWILCMNRNRSTLLPSSSGARSGPLSLGRLIQVRSPLGPLVAHLQNLHAQARRSLRVCGRAGCSIATRERRSAVLAEFFIPPACISQLLEEPGAVRLMPPRVPGFPQSARSLASP